MQGEPLFTIREGRPRVKGVIEIADPQSEMMAVIRPAMDKSLNQRWQVETRDGPDLAVNASLWEYEYQINQGAKILALISRWQLQLRETIKVEIAAAPDDAFILAVIAALEWIELS